MPNDVIDILTNAKKKEVEIIQKIGVIYQNLQKNTM
jgi:hypothetical protein